MANRMDSDPRPACPECKAPLVLTDTSDLHYHWLCRELNCDGSVLLARKKQLAREAIARDMADKRSVVGLFGTSDDRRKDQVSFRRVASTLSSDHRPFRYFSKGEGEAIQTAAAALRRLARATEAAKEIMARREVREKAERERPARIDNQQIFQAVIAQSFDRDTVLLRCEAMADFLEPPRGYGGSDIRAWLATYRRSPDERRWTQLVQRTGQRLDDETFVGKSQDDFEGHWRQWKAGRRYRAAIADAQAQGVKGGGPDV